MFKTRTLFIVAGILLILTIILNFTVLKDKRKDKMLAFRGEYARGRLVFTLENQTDSSLRVPVPDPYNLQITPEGLIRKQEWQSGIRFSEVILPKGKMYFIVPLQYFHFSLPLEKEVTTVGFKFNSSERENNEGYWQGALKDSLNFFRKNDPWLQNKMQPQDPPSLLSL